MKKALLFCTVFVFLIACGGVKKTQEAINTGNYLYAIDNAIKNLADNKTKKGHQPYVILLEQAFKRHTERELNTIDFLIKEGNSVNYEQIFTTYAALKSLQQRVQPLLPLPIYEENRNASFQFNNYDSDIITAKNNLSEHLYVNATNLLNNAGNKYDYRTAYDDLCYLEKISPGYSDTKQLMAVAHSKGLDFIKVQMTNDTEQIVPARLEQELLNFNTFGLDDLWTQYHTKALPNIKYNYEMNVAFRDINITPEQIQEKQVIKEKQIKDGFRYLRDDAGNIVKDSLGNKIKVDKFKTVTCSFYQFTQHKAAAITGNVRYINLQTQQQLNAYPLASQFVFEHVYARYDGDKRALDTDLISLINLGAVPFPTNEQMVYDAGEDLKSRLKNIVVTHKFN